MLKIIKCKKSIDIGYAKNIFMYVDFIIIKQNKIIKQQNNKI